MRVSYAQNREDVLLARALPEPTGFYIDVGAADPLIDSVTKYFYELGWSGINIEPQAGDFAKLAADRPRDINLSIVLSDEPGTLTFYSSPVQPGWSTLEEDVARQFMAQGIPATPETVAARTLAQVCEEHVRGEISFLKIDVEGAERKVLLGGDFKTWRPRIVVIEATEQGSPVPNHQRWEDVILGFDYHYATFDGLNRYYVRSEDEALVPILQVPPNYFDQFRPYEHEVQLQFFQSEASVRRCKIEAVRGRLATLRYDLTRRPAGAHSLRIAS